MNFFSSSSYSLIAARSRSAFCSSVSTRISVTASSFSALAAGFLAPFFYAAFFFSSSSAARRASSSMRAFSASSAARRSASSFCLMASSSFSFLVSLRPEGALPDLPVSNGSFFSSLGFSNFSSYLSRFCSFFLKPLISLLKNSSLFLTCLAISE